MLFVLYFVHFLWQVLRAYTTLHVYHSSVFYPLNCLFSLSSTLCTLGKIVSISSSSVIMVLYRCVRSPEEHTWQEEHLCGDSILDGTRGMNKCLHWFPCMDKVNDLLKIVSIYAFQVNSLGNRLWLIGMAKTHSHDQCN